MVTAQQCTSRTRRRSLLYESNRRLAWLRINQTSQLGLQKRTIGTATLNRHLDSISTFWITIMKKTVSEADVLARKLARCYQYERDAVQLRLKHKGTYRLPSFWCDNHIWRRLISHAGDNKIDPLRYVRWALQPLQVYPDRFPEPNQLLSFAGMCAYREYLGTVREQIELSFHGEAESANSRFQFRHRAYGDNPEDAWLGTVVGGDLNLTPLFRYIMARKLGTPRAMEIAGNYVNDALQMFSFHPDEYQAVYGAKGVLPEDFAGHATRYYDRLITAYADQFNGGKP